MAQTNAMAIQVLLGHRGVSTTTIYTHVVKRGGRGCYHDLPIVSEFRRQITGDEDDAGSCCEIELICPAR